MAGKEGNIPIPNFPENYDKSRSKMPASNPPGKIPPKMEPKPFAGLPGSTSPRPLKMEGH
jgi:hypothetical protein